MIAYLFDSGMVMTFDEATGNQVPTHQGRNTPELMRKLREANAELVGFGCEQPMRWDYKLVREILESMDVPLLDSLPKDYA